MLKELNLVARTIYSFMAVFALSGISGLTLWSLWGMGVLIFATSFLFQYFVLYFALKHICKTPRDRLLCLIGCLVCCLVGLVGSSVMIPHLSELSSYGSAEDFIRAGSWWSSIFVTFSAAFVALTCTRRAWTRHGALG